MNENKTEGATRDLGGKVQDAVGDAATQAEAKVNQAAGHAQQAFGQVRDFVVDQPVTAFLSAMGIGVVLGFILAKN